MTTHTKSRNDTTVIGHGASLRDYVPTTPETIWVQTWKEFADAGGERCWNEDQTEIKLSLPAGHKFSINFDRQPA